MKKKERIEKTRVLDLKASCFDRTANRLIFSRKIGSCGT
jgi:hypothetical protein